jgi:3-oxoacyl-[acyl-carrier-protein] synthase II
MREVVITGLGVTSPLGHSPEVFFENLLAGKSGIKRIQRFDPSDYPVHFAGEIQDFDATTVFEAKEASRTSRFIQYAMHAALQAVDRSGLREAKIDLNRAGVLLGSGMGGIEVFTDNAGQLVTKGPKRVSPFFIPMAITNMAAGMVAIRLGWRGPNFCITSACASGNHAIMTAADNIRLGRADIMLAGGSEEAVCPASLAGFSNMRALSRRNDAPEKASRPWDKDRDGFVLGEGGAVLVLESREHAEARGAKILATLRGYGATCDAYHMSAPLESGEGVMQAIELALADAGIQKEDVGLVNAHATSTPLGDVAEVKALQKVFGSHLDQMLIHGTKSMTGHLLGGTSALEAVDLIMTLNSGKVHPTLNVDNQDPECPIHCVPGKATTTTTRFGISNSFGFGGHNSVVVFEKGDV